MGVNTTQPTVPQKRTTAKPAGTNQASDPPKSGPKPPGAGSKAGGPVVKAAVQGSTLKSADIKTAVSNAPLPGHPPGKRGDDPAAGRVADRRVATPGTSGVPLAGPAESRGAPAKAPDSRPASKPAGNPTSPVKADSPHSDVAGRRGDAVSKLIGDTAQVSGMSNANQRALTDLRQRYEQGQVDRSEALKQRARIDMDNTTTQNARTQAQVKVAEVGASVAQGALEGSKLAVGGIALAASGGNIAAATAAQVAFTQVADSAAAISAEATGDAAVQARFAKEGQSVPAALIKAAQGQKVDPGGVLNKLGGDTASALTNVVTTAVTGGLGNVAKGGLVQVASKAPLSLGTRAVEVTAGALGHGAANVLTTAVNQEVDKAKIRGDDSLSEAQKQQQLTAIDKHRGTNLAFAFLQGGAGQVAGAAWTDQGKLNVGGLAGQAASNVGLGVVQEKLTSEGPFDLVKSVTSNTIGTLQEAAKHSPRVVGPHPVEPQSPPRDAYEQLSQVGARISLDPAARAQADAVGLNMMANGNLDGTERVNADWQSRIQSTDPSSLPRPAINADPDTTHTTIIVGATGTIGNAYFQSALAGTDMPIVPVTSRPGQDQPGQGISPSTRLTVGNPNAMPGQVRETRFTPAWQKQMQGANNVTFVFAAAPPMDKTGNNRFDWFARPTMPVWLANWIPLMQAKRPEQSLAVVNVINPGTSFANLQAYLGDDRTIPFGGGAVDLSRTQEGAHRGEVASVFGPHSNDMTAFYVSPGPSGDLRVRVNGAVPDKGAAILRKEGKWQTDPVGIAMQKEVQLYWDPILARSDAVVRSTLSIPLTPDDIGYIQEKVNAGLPPAEQIRLPRQLVITAPRAFNPEAQRWELDRPIFDALFAQQPDAVMRGLTGTLNEFAQMKGLLRETLEQLQPELRERWNGQSDDQVFSDDNRDEIRGIVHSLDRLEPLNLRQTKLQERGQ